MKLAISIVLYHNGAEAEHAIRCVLNSSIQARIYLVDNSSTDELRRLAVCESVHYIYNNKNIGYGAGHNVAIRRSIADGIPYHIVMNPDIAFGENVLEQIISYMDMHPEVGSLMPKVYNEDGSLQRLCKLLPTPLDLFTRRFVGDIAYFRRRDERYELHHFNYDKVIDTPCLSGCFMFLRTSALERCGLFDTRFFLYLEDYDLTRRINQHYETIFFPNVSIVHGHGKGSYKSRFLLKVHMVSAIKYFNKWGWFFDKNRSQLNNKVLKYINDSR
ncbi:glycosyltransferase [Pedobacter deserti]|uniref:glycosyltransferase n=1 Tax=Pedobacter deserti TaxID=2817382 RepID=UPI00210B1430|nr:glycosyltransferase family 2 protein [Pedobacter sp. SYSU D00382]